MSPRTLELLTARDPATLRDVFQETNPYLLRILGARGIFGAAAEDLVQETWRVFLENLERFRGDSQIKTFVAGILFNKLRELRRFEKRVVVEEDHEKIFAGAFTDDGWWINEPRDPHHLLHSKELLRQIEDCLEGLTPAQGEAFTLKEIEQDSTENICKIMAVSVSHLGVLLFRAKDKLRQCLEGKIGEGAP